LAAYRARHHRPPGDLRLWRRSLSIPIHRLLRLAHGTWPPPAPIDPLLERFRAEIIAGRYGRWRHGEMDRAARQFLGFIRDRGVTPEQVRPVLVESFLRARLERYRRRHGHEPPDPRHWRRRAMAPLRRLLRLAQGDWPPPPPPPSDPRERFCLELREGFRRWMMEVRGLSPLSFTKDWHNAGRLLEWLGEQATVEALRQISPADLDVFLAWRMAGLRRATRCGVCTGLRSFLHYLRAAGFIERDLASCVGRPSRYWNEDIPSAFTEAQVKAMLAAARGDRGPAGLRDYAILLLLATYGLRAGEITHLRLSDIDWRRERFRITQSKTGRSSHLPLTSAVGNAIVDYLRHGRPRSAHREVFLRANAPYPPFARGSSLTALVGRRMRRAGVAATGKHGAHAFRYARAVGLLRAAVPLKTISDLLGHSTSASTEIYLKLDTDELRGVSLDVPQEVSP
jgi:site-specific recombinase XerD